jgi:carboxymethylenebutenolidase
MLIECSDVDIDTGLGVMRCRVYRPQDVSRKWPALILWAEIFGITGPIARSAQIFAGSGAVVLVPEFFHGFLAPGEALRYTPEDTARGNAHKADKALASYDADIAACFAWCLACPHANGAVGTAGFCLGGGLAFRAALHPACRAAVCWYATDIHKGSLSKDGDDSLARVAEIKGEIVVMCVGCAGAQGRSRWEGVGLAAQSPLPPFSTAHAGAPTTPRTPRCGCGCAATGARTRTCRQRVATRCARRWRLQAPRTSFWR